MVMHVDLFYGSVCRKVHRVVLRKNFRLWGRRGIVLCWARLEYGRRLTEEKRRFTVRVGIGMEIRTVLQGIKILYPEMLCWQPGKTCNQGITE
jgi:hypothetical protein